MRLAWCALLVLSVFGAGACKRELKLNKGDELYSVLDEAVLGVSLRANDERVEVERKKPEQPFTFCFVRGRSSACCGENPGLMRALRGLFEVRVRDLVSESDARRVLAQGTQGWIDLTVRDVIQGVEPFRLRMYQDPQSGLVYAQQPGDKQLVVVDAKLLILLSARCGSPAGSEHDGG